MSQSGILRVSNTILPPNVPTTFVADTGSAVPALNILNIFGTSISAGSVPVQTTGVGDTITIEVQKSQAIAFSDATKVGLAAFNSASFGVDANGFVTLSGGGVAMTNIAVDAFTPPGTNPVVPSGGNITITGGQVSSGTVGANVIRTNSLSANSLTIEIQRSTAVAATDSTKNGVAHFDSSKFTVDANGFVSTSGTGIAQTITGTTGGALSPTAGNWNILGASTAAGTTPVNTSGSGSTLTVNVQKSQAIASTDATKIGLAAFSSASFAVDANGFVTLAGGGLAIDSIHPDSGTDPVVPTAAGLVNIVGSGSTTTVGSLNTLTVQLTGLTNHALLIGAGTTTITKLGAGSTGQILQTNTTADPTWSTATYPSTATGTGTLLRADGTNWVSTTSTYPNTNAISTLLYASSANVMSALATANNGLLVTSSAGVPSILAGPGTTGNILQSNAAAAPSFSTATYPSTATGTGTILRADGTNWVATTATYPATTTINQLLYSSANNVISGLATANRAVITTTSAGVPVATALATDGQLIIGSTAGAPAATTLTGGTGVTITNASNAITIAATGGGVTWSVITADQSAVVGNGYICNKAGLLTLTLPASAAIGDIIEVTGINTAAGWKIAQNANQQIFFGNQSTTSGITGSLASVAIRDSVKLLCVVAGSSTVYNVISSIGNITVA